MAKIEFQNVSKSFGQVKVIENLNLTIEDGKFTVLVGSSGCGKTTLLRMIAGIGPATSGRILMDGKDITDVDPGKRDVAMVFQNYALWPHLSVFENVAFGLRAAGVPKKVIDEKVAESLALVRMSDFADRRVPSLSGGQQQRIALARAIAVDPQVLLLDEPLSNLDAKLRDEMRSEIARICRERSLTAIYVTHDRREALSWATGLPCLTGERFNRPVRRWSFIKSPVPVLQPRFWGMSTCWKGWWTARRMQCCGSDRRSACFILRMLS